MIDFFEEVLLPVAFIVALLASFGLMAMGY